ncbi:MAG: STM4015 family protein [Polyangiaceae bacterium]
MTIGEHITEFEGRKIQEWHVGDHVNAKHAIRLSVEYDDDNTGAQLVAALAEATDADKIEALVIGQWDGEQFDSNADDLITALVEAKDKLTSLKALFVGEIVYEECEISWLHQGNYAPLLKAYPKLETLYIRGGEDLSWGEVSHAHLKKLVIQTGGLPSGVIQEICASKLPELEHLELWLGSDNYGGDANAETVAPLLSGRLFPKLKYLGLRDSEASDAIAVAIANAPVLTHLEELDLSMGTLGNEGGTALLESSLVPKLKRLNLSHHYMGEALTKKLKALKGVKVDVSEAEGEAGPGERYISVSE